MVQFALQSFSTPLFSQTCLPVPSVWKALKKDGNWAELSVKVERKSNLKVIWVRLEGVVDSFNAEELCVRIRSSLQKGKENMVLDLERLKSFEERSIHIFCERLHKYRSRILIVATTIPQSPAADWIQLNKVFNFCTVPLNSSLWK